MKIHAHILVWNEERILPFTLDHYSQFCNKIIVYDNMSDDGSYDICKRYDKVSIKRWKISEKKSNERVQCSLRSSMYKSSRGEADWVIVCDCDELLYHDNIIDKLQEYKDMGVNVPRIDGHDMVSETFPSYDGTLITDIVKIGSKTYDIMCKNIVFNPRLDVTYGMGAHTFNAHGAIFSDSADIKLLHYKFLGKDYVLRRYKQLADRLSEFNKQNGLSVHWTRPPLDYIDKMLEEQYRVI